MLYDRLKQRLEEILPENYVVCYGTDSAATATKAVVLTEYAGTPLNDTTMATSRSIQLIVRNADAGEAYKDIWRIFKELVTSNEYRVDTFWMQYKIKNSPISMGYDKRGHQRFVMNLTIITDNQEE